MPKEDNRQIEPLPWRSDARHEASMEEMGDARSCIARILAIAKIGRPAYSATTRPEKCSIKEITDPCMGRWGHVAQLVSYFDGNFGVEFADSQNAVLIGVGGLCEADAIKLFKLVGSDICATGKAEDYVREAYYGKGLRVSWETASKLPEEVESGEKPLADGSTRDLDSLRKALINKRLRAKR